MLESVVPRLQLSGVGGKEYCGTYHRYGYEIYEQGNDVPVCTGGNSADVSVVVVPTGRAVALEAVREACDRAGFAVATTRAGVYVGCRYDRDTEREYELCMGGAVDDSDGNSELLREAV